MARAYIVHKKAAFVQTVRVCVLFVVPVTADNEETKRRRFVCTQRGPESDFANESRPEPCLVLAEAAAQGQLKRRTAGSSRARTTCWHYLPRWLHTQQTGVKWSCCGMWQEACGCSIRNSSLSLTLSHSLSVALLKHINFKYYFGSLFLSRLINEICNVFVRVLFVLCRRDVASFDKLIAISLRHVSIIYFDNNNNGKRSKTRKKGIEM